MSSLRRSQESVIIVTCCISKKLATIVLVYEFIKLYYLCNKLLEYMSIKTG
jgi:hypothetical protein